MEPYVPINCERHDELLALATLRHRCILEVEGTDGARASVEGVIEDVYARTGVEYLRLRDGPTVRLDRIRALNGHGFP